MTIQVHTSRMWIVDPDWIEVQPEWQTYAHEWLRKVNCDPLYQWMWDNPYAGQGRKCIPFFQFTTILGHHILLLKLAKN